MKKNDLLIPPRMKIGGKVHLFLFLLLLFNVFVVNAQNKIRVNVQKKDLVEVFKQVQEQSDYRFMFSNKDVVLYTSVTVQVEDASVENILNIAFKETDLVYIIEQNIIYVKKKSLASQRTVRGLEIGGLVTDEQRRPLPGVTILLEGTGLGTTTNKEGRYLLVIPEQKSFALIFSFVGMETKRIPYEGKDTIHVVLKEDVKAVDEVVVTGYQTMRKSDVVGSVTTIKASDIMMPAYTSIDQMLQGRVAGMMVMNTSSRVGTSPKIRVRGTSTILGNQDPLWVVDGIIQPDPMPIDQNNMMIDDLKNILGNQISWLNPSDIETITVLKDASATAIYGSKAANGVIVITTKRGQQDRTTVNYSGTFSFRARPNYGMFNLMNSKERIRFSQEAFEAGAIYSDLPVSSLDTYEGIMRLFYDRKISREEAEDAASKLAKVNTNWLKLLTRNSFSHNHNLSISGGGSKVTYNASLGYSDQSGIEINNDAKNLSGRVNIGVQLHPKVRVDLNLVGSINKTWGYAAGVNPMEYATGTSRSVLAYDDNGDRYFQQKRTRYSYNSHELFLGYNVLNEIDHSYSKNKSSQINGMLNFSWEILPGLVYEFVGGISSSAGVSESYAGEQTYYVAGNYRGYDWRTELFGSEKYNAAMLRHGGELYNGSSDASGWNIQNKVTYAVSFREDHRINVLLGTEVVSSLNIDRAHTIFGYDADRGEQVMKPTPLDEITTIANAPKTGWGILDKLYDGNGWRRSSMNSNQFSVFATLVYSFKNRYVLNASVRNDASNRFGQDQNKRFDPTYSFGVSWNIAQEPWLQKISHILNQFTLRASFGIQGNTVNSISPELILQMDEVKQQYGEYMSKISRIPNPDLSWERTKSWNFGADIQLLQWITMNLEYYTKSSNNIVNQAIALEYGLGGMEVNGGRIINSGVEYTLNITPIRTKDWGWTIGLNSSKNWNEAKTQSISEIGLREFLRGSSSKVLKKGYPLSGFWSFSFKELNHQTGAPEFNLLYQEDAEGNFVIDDDGRRVLRNIGEYTDMLVYSGTTEPDFTGGITTRLRWKGLTFAANCSMLIGAKKRLPTLYPDNKGNIPLSESNLSRDLIKRWKKPGDEVNTNIPGVYTGRIANTVQLPIGGTSLEVLDMWSNSDVRVVSASFFRCQQMSLTWQVNELWCARLGMKSLSFNVLMNNVFVIADKKFNGFDPELGDSVQPKTYSLGISIGL